MSIVYNSIAKDITQRNRLSDMSVRDKDNLCWQLLQDLGITARLIADKDLYQKFEVIWREQTAKHWNE